MDAWERMFRDEEEALSFFLQEEFGRGEKKMKKQTLTDLTDQAIALMKQMRNMGEHEPGYMAVKREWLAVQKQIAQAGNHSESKSAARARARR